MLRSVQRLERRGGFRPRHVTTRRDYLEYVEIIRIQGAERETWEADRQPKEPHKRWERLLRRVGYGVEQGSG